MQQDVWNICKLTYRKIHFDHITYQSLALDLQLKYIVLFLSES